MPALLDFVQANGWEIVKGAWFIAFTFFGLYLKARQKKLEDEARTSEIYRQQAQRAHDFVNNKGEHWIAAVDSLLLTVETLQRQQQDLKEHGPVFIRDSAQRLIHVTTDIKDKVDAHEKGLQTLQHIAAETKADVDKLRDICRKIPLPPEAREEQNKP